MTWDDTWADWQKTKIHEVVDDTWVEHLEHREIEERERLERNTSLHQGCRVCMAREGKGIYGGKCRGCFDAQREEREEW